MEWLWSIATAIGGWWLGHWQSTQDRKRGVEEGAQAAFDMEIALGRFLLERDRKRLKEAFKDIDLTDKKQVSAVAQVVGDIYTEIIRRNAFSDARTACFTQHDRDSWKRDFDEEMPGVGFSEGYLQAIKDVIAGAAEYAAKYFEKEVAASIVKKIDQSQREFADPGDFYLDSYDPDGKVLGAELLVEVVCRTFDRAEKERGSISATATDPKCGSDD